MLKHLKTTALATLASITLLTLPAWASLEDNLKHTPAGADGFVAIKTDRSEWDYFLKRKPFSTMGEELMKDVATGIKEGLGLDFEKDLLPMLGTHISVAVYEAELKKGEDLPVLIALDLRDTANFPKVIAALKTMSESERDRVLLEEKYKDISLYGFATKEKQAGSPYLALSQNTLLIGSKALISKAIDTAASGTSLMGDTRFKPVYKSLNTEKLWLYFNSQNIDKLMALIPETEELEEINLSDVTDSLKAYDSMGFGMDLNARGLRFKSFVKIGSGAPKSAMDSYVRKMEQAIRKPAQPLSGVLNAAPGRPLLFAAMQGTHLLSEGINLAANNDKDMKALFNEILGGMRRFSGLDFNKDLVGMSDGRAGLAVFYPDSKKTFDQPPYALIYMGIKDNPKFLSTLTSKLKLDLSALEEENAEGGKKKKGPDDYITFPAKPQATYQGSPIYMANLNNPVKALKQELNIQPGFTYVGNMWLFGSNIESLKAGIDYIKGKQENLNANRYFSGLRSTYGLQDDAGMMFIDLTKAVSILNFFMGDDDEVKQLQPTLSALKAIASGGSYNTDGAEGVFVIDIDMDKVDFELIGKFLGEQDVNVEVDIKEEPAAAN